MRAYKVTVETTNGLHKTTQAKNGEYFDCHDSVLIVVTDDPKPIFDKFRVIRLEDFGPGYYLKEPKEA